MAGLAVRFTKILLEKQGLVGQEGETLWVGTVLLKGAPESPGAPFEMLVLIH